MGGESESKKEKSKEEDKPKNKEKTTKESGSNIKLQTTHRADTPKTEKCSDLHLSCEQHSPIESNTPPQSKKGHKINEHVVSNTAQVEMELLAKIRFLETELCAEKDEKELLLARLRDALDRIDLLLSKTMNRDQELNITEVTEGEENTQLATIGSRELSIQHNASRELVASKMISNIVVPNRKYKLWLPLAIASSGILGASAFILL